MIVTFDSTAIAEAAEAFDVDGKWYISSCSRPVADIGHSHDRSTGLFLARLQWDHLLPRIVPL